MNLFVCFDFRSVKESAIFTILAHTEINNILYKIDFDIITFNLTVQFIN